MEGKYKKNFIDQVVCKIDFSRSQPEEILFSGDIEKAIIDSSFSRKGIDRVIKNETVNINVKKSDDASSLSHQSETFIVKQYFYSDNDNSLSLSKNYLFFNYKQHIAFNDFKDSFKNIIDVIYKNIPSLITKRLGLRYINVFRLNDFKKKYFKQDISSQYSPCFSGDDSINILRGLTLHELKIKNTIMRFEYGLFNPKYPSVMLNKDFKLDYDCYTEELLDDSLKHIEYIEKVHTNIIDMFECSITDELRKVLNK